MNPWLTSGGCLVCWLSPTFSKLFSSCDCSLPPSSSSSSSPLTSSCSSSPSFPLYRHVFLTQEKVERVECGGHFVLLLTSCGKVLSFGDNCYGQTGVGHERKFVCHPTPISFQNPSEKIIDLSAGQAHSLCVSQKGQVFAWGWNLDGQCSFPQSTPKIFTPQQITFPLPPLPLSLPPLPLSLPPLSGEKEKNHSQTPSFRAKKVSGGFAHSLVLLEDHNQNTRVVVFGSNKYGECGHPPSSPSLPPTFLPLPPSSPSLPPPKKQKIVNVLAGDRTSFLLLFSGGLLSFGLNNFGQLGVSSRELVISQQTQVSDVVDAELIGCGSGCSAYIPDDEEELWVSGWRGGQYSATNHFDEVSLIQFPKEKKKEREERRKLVVQGQQIIVKFCSRQLYLLGSLSQSLLSSSPSLSFFHFPSPSSFDLPLVVGGRANGEREGEGEERKIGEEGEVRGEGVIIESGKGTFVDVSCCSHSLFISYSF